MSTSILYHAFNLKGITYRTTRGNDVPRNLVQRRSAVRNQTTRQSCQDSRRIQNCDSKLFQASNNQCRPRGNQQQD